MNKIGELLKKAREEQNLTLEQVAQKTKIHIQKLQAIEDGRMDLLPAKVFTLGLVKSYARLLKVDQELFNKLCIEAFDFHPEVLELSHLPNNEEPIETQPVGRFQIPKALSIFLSIVVSIALLFVIYLVVDKMNAYSSEEEVSGQQYVETPSDSVVDEKVESKDLKSEEKKPDVIKSETNSGKAYPHNDASTANPQLKEASLEKVQILLPETNKTNQVDEKPKENLNAEMVKSIEPEASTVTATTINNKNDTQSSDVEIKDEDVKASQVIHSDNKLSITSLEPVRIEIIWSDGYVQVMLMKSNETKTLVFSTPILVKVNNGGAIKVSYNDRPYRIPGIFNQPIELKYP